MKPSKRQAGPTLYWHPNFRIAETLPDTKVIRTSFVVNAAAAAVVIALGLLVWQQEMAISEVRAQCDDWQGKIAHQTPRYKAVTGMQKDFTEAEKKVRQIEEFLAPKLVGSDFLLLVAETLPRLIQLDSLELTGDLVRLRGSVAGGSASVSQGYVDQLAAHPRIKEIMESVRLSSQNRDAAGNRFTFEVELKFKVAAAPAKAAKDKAGAKSAKTAKPKVSDE